MCDCNGGVEKGKEKPDCRPSEKKTCPAKCPTDFVLSAPCRIIKANGGRVQMSASELPEYPAGTYSWATTSTKISLTNPNSSTVTVVALATPSASRDAETITVTRTAAGCSPVSKAVNVTVAKVTFSAATGQQYGYDDYDTPADSSDDHICVKKSDHTFLMVTIEGGAVGTDFNFVCDDSSICAPAAPGGNASFDLRLNAGNKTKDHTTLHAKCKCPAATSFASIEVHVYKEELVEVVVAKVYDNTVAGTNLYSPNADYAAQANTVNSKMKQGVVKFSITNYDSGNAQTDVHYDLDGNGALSYDIKNGGGAELNAIKSALTGTGTKTRVAIIRDMKSYYYLSAAAAVGDTTISVTAGSVFNYPAGRSVPLGTGASQENITVASTSGSTITLGSALTKDHAIGEPLEFPAAGWSCDPILVTEGSSSLATLTWTIAHEAGHRDLSLRDVVDTTNVMHYSQEGTDYRLRYCPRTKRYEAGTENQWETVPR